jgi:ribonucleotide monophosphatase NagD (HAD superfamily)
MIPEITIDTVIDRYAVLLVDNFGVFVDGAGALPGAVALIERLNRSGKAYDILTNDASRLPATRAAQFQRHGLAIPPGRIITSGSLLPGYFATHRLTGARCAVLEVISKPSAR